MIDHSDPGGAGKDGHREGDTTKRRGTVISRAEGGRRGLRQSPGRQAAARNAQGEPSEEKRRGRSRSANLLNERLGKSPTAQGLGGFNEKKQIPAHRNKRRLDGNKNESGTEPGRERASGEGWEGCVFGAFSRAWQKRRPRGMRRGSRARRGSGPSKTSPRENDQRGDDAKKQKDRAAHAEADNAVKPTHDGNVGENAAFRGAPMKGRREYRRGKGKLRRTRVHSGGRESNKGEKDRDRLAVMETRDVGLSPFIVTSASKGGRSQWGQGLDLLGGGTSAGQLRTASRSHGVRRRRARGSPWTSTATALQSHRGAQFDSDGRATMATGKGLTAQRRKRESAASGQN